MNRCPGSDSAEIDPLDQEAMTRLLEDTSVEFLPELIQVFAEESGQRLERIHEYMSVPDPVSLGLEVHSLKGTAATFGARRLRKLTETFELAAARNDIGRMITLAEQVEASIIEVLNELKAFHHRVSLL